MKIMLAPVVFVLHVNAQNQPGYCVRQHEQNAVTARQAGSGTRLMKPVLIFSAHTSGLFAAFTAGAPDGRRFRLSIRETTPEQIVQKGSARVDRR